MAPAWPKGQIADWRGVAAQASRPDLIDLFDVSLDPEVQTDKQLVKLLPCQFCKRPLIVTTFYVLAWAKCSPCKGVESGVREPGSVDVVQAGRTEPKLAADLRKLLINASFATAICPVHPDSDDHEMELKHVHHNDNYGPGEWRHVENTRVWTQTAPGESVMHQCRKCLAVVTYTTTAVHEFKRVNEVQPGRNANVWATVLGTRDE